jgi:hypothetical protein
MLTTPDRKSRGQRTTALTLGLMSEILLGATLVIWSGGSAQPLGREALGRSGSFAVVTAAMVLLVGGMLALGVARRLSRPALQVAVLATVMGFAGLGVVALAALFQDPGIGILLVFGWTLIIPVVLGITRASADGRRKR